MENKYESTEIQEKPVEDRKVIERLVRLEVNSELTYKTTNELKQNYATQSTQLSEVISGMRGISLKMDSVIEAQQQLSDQMQTEIMPTINKYKDNERFLIYLSKLSKNKFVIVIAIALVIISSNESLWNFIATIFSK